VVGLFALTCEANGDDDATAAAIAHSGVWRPLSHARADHRAVDPRDGGGLARYPRLPDPVRQQSSAAKFLASVGFQNGLFWTYIVGSVEFVCGLCLALGLLTRVVSAPIIGFLVVAIVTYHWQFGFAWENRGIEYPLFWSIVVLHFLVRGGGRWSLDALIGREL
jgi:uncharacterized membrane protein YphA (DoxX/SURF4 family)